MEKKKNTFEKIGFRFAWRGLFTAIANEHNFKIHLVAAVLTIIAGFILQVSKIEWLFLIASIMIVFIAELSNTAIETLCDLVTTEQNSQIEFVKDVGASAVLIAAVFAAITGITVFAPKVIVLLGF